MVVRWDCLAGPCVPIWQMSAASCLPLGSILAPEGYQQRTGAIACGSFFGGCILLEVDISWVSLCVPMRPGKNSVVAPFEFECLGELRASCPRLHLYVHAGFADAPTPPRPNTGRWAVCAPLPVCLGSADVYVWAPWASVLVLTRILLLP